MKHGICGLLGWVEKSADFHENHAGHDARSRDSRASLELVTAVYHSAWTGTDVALPVDATHPKYESWLPASN